MEKLAEKEIIITEAMVYNVVNAGRFHEEIIETLVEIHQEVYAKRALALNKLNTTLGIAENQLETNLIE